MTPNQYPDMYRSIVLGTAKSPGAVTLTGHDRDWKWDIEEADGETGGSSTLVGEPVRDFQATFQLTSPEDQIAWPAFQRVLESTVSGAEPQAKPIYHPDLVANKFSDVCVQTIGGIMRDEKGGALVVVKFIEHRPPRPKPSAPAGSSGGGGSGGASQPSDANAGDDYDPNAARKEELEALLDEARNV